MGSGQVVKPVFLAIVRLGFGIVIRVHRSNLPSPNYPIAIPARAAVIRG